MLSGHELTVSTSPRISADVATGIFELERAVFGTEHSSCPQTLQAFTRQRLSHPYVAAWVDDAGTVVGVRLFNLVDDSHAHSRLMAIHTDWRSLGLAKLLCASAVTYLRWAGLRTITSWTRPENVGVVKLLSEYAPVVSAEPVLSDEEWSAIVRLKDVGLIDRLPSSRDRRIAGFHELRDGSHCDAMLWVHRIPA